MTTDLALLATRGASIVDRGDYLVVETPDDPGYYFGNLLALPAAPQIGEVAYWTRRFALELGKKPEIRHVTLQWDDPTGATGAADELVAAGFVVEVHEVRTAAQLVTPPAPAGVTIRAMDPDDVRASIELAWGISDRHDESYRAFLRRRAAWHASLVERGAAGFWGAYDDATGELAGSLGLVPLGDVRRYQDVQTAPTHRKRGIAAALLATAAASGTTPLVIVAELGGAAARVYERLGLRVVEHIGSACKYPS